MKTGLPIFIKLTRADGRSCIVNFDNVLAVLPGAGEDGEESVCEEGNPETIIYGTGGGIFPVIESVDQIYSSISKRIGESNE